MPQIDLDATVTAIVGDLTAGKASPPEVGLVYFEHAVATLRIAAFDHNRSITQQQCREIDAAIRAAQPLIMSRDPASGPLRLMVGALHVITADWSRQNRQPTSASPPILLEAYALARMLPNDLNSGNIINQLRRRRATMDEAQLLAMRDVVNTLYPPAEVMHEPAPFYATGNIH